MPYFNWKGIGSGGKRRKGKLEAPDERQVENYLKRLRISDYTIKEAPKDIQLMKPKVKPKDVMLFTRQFSTMIDAGLPLVQSLKVLGDQVENPTFKSALRDINNSVQSGSTLSDSMRKYPKMFDDLYCNLVAAGEAAGILDSILKRLAEYMEKAERLKRKVKSAMAYPAVVLFVALTVVIVLLVFVIPVFKEVFEGMGSSLPTLTQYTVDASELLVNNFVVVGIVTLILGVIGFKFSKTQIGTRLIDTLMLKLPVFGDLTRKSAVAKFSRTLATMLQAGVPIITSLDIVASTAGNKIIEEAIIESRVAIAEGRSLTDPFLESGVFPAMVTQMIAVGEEAGALDAMLLKVADFYDEEVDAAVDAVTALIEPMLIVFLGVTVGTLVIAMYMPIFTMGQNVS
ncbi:type II secretion system F family protein [Deltaproteobacteria bacterium OttesenSCG-928-M10]|nr:type II secretion system F family protein [Deltaproteobacteria bacterium OttesenSCG-928-M10]